MKYDITTIGDAFEDVFVEPDLKVRSDRDFASGKGICFEFGEKVPLKSVKYEVGGSACNIAVGMSRLGYKTSMVTAVGEDSPADKIIERLDQENVDISNINQNAKIQTGFSVIFSIDGERTIFPFHALKDYSELKIKKSLKTEWIFLTSIGQKSEEIEKRIVKEVSENNAKFAWNPGSLQIEKGSNHFRHLLKCASVLFLNREEAIKFLNMPMKPQAEEIIKKLQLLGPKIVVVTDGKEGAKAYDGNTLYEISANRRIEVVDATGAGDAFATGFLGRLMKENWKENISPDSIDEAMKWAIKNSSSVIGYVGGQAGLLKRTEQIED